MTMRKSKQETALTRERIVTAAASEFRQHGIVATGLADLMSPAGLTHGGFYRHFDSKDQLGAEASAVASAAKAGKTAAAPSTERGRKRARGAAWGRISAGHRPQ